MKIVNNSLRDSDIRTRFIKCRKNAAIIPASKSVNLGKTTSI